MLERVWRKGNTLALLAGMQIDIATMGINMEISLKTRNKTTITCLVAQSCLILCNPMDYSLPASSVHRDSPGKNTEVGCHALLQGIFPTQGLNSSLLQSPALRGRIFITSDTWEAQTVLSSIQLGSLSLFTLANIQAHLKPL